MQGGITLNQWVLGQVFRVSTWAGVVAGIGYQGFSLYVIEPTTAVFGSLHTYQGAAGVIDASLMGLFLGVLYLGTKSNLWAPIVAHATIDSLGFFLLSMGHYPGP